MEKVDVKNICRVCLQHDIYLVSLFEVYNAYFLSEVFLEISGISILRDDDQLPNQICESCAVKIINAGEIRRLILNSDEYLRQQYLQVHVEKINIDEKNICTTWKSCDSGSNFTETVDNFSYITNLITNEDNDLRVKDEGNDNNDIIDNNDDNDDDDNDDIKNELDLSFVNEQIYKTKTAKKGPPKRQNKLQKHKVDYDERHDDRTNDNSNEKDILCEICKKIFPNCISFRRHQNYHKIEKTKCPLCPKEFAHKSNLKRHLLVHKNKKLFDCDKCSKSFTQSSDMYEHLKVHRNINSDKDEYTMKCDLCGDETKSYANHINHMKNIHNIDKVKPFKCNICDMLFTSKQGMYRHIDNIHENNRRNLRNRDKNFLCNSCGKSFYTNFHLEVHIRSHTGEKPYQCQYCEKAFSQLSGLRMHTHTHTGERPFQCKKCKKTFNQYGHVREHMLTHTDLKPHVCNVCNHGFRVKGNLTAHMLIHSGKKPYVCQICNKRFIQNTKLEQHMKRVHNSN